MTKILHRKDLSAEKLTRVDLANCLAANELTRDAIPSIMFKQSILPSTN
jgi:hypothetical protein